MTSTVLKIQPALIRLAAAEVARVRSVRFDTREERGHGMAADSAKKGKGTQNKTHRVEGLGDDPTAV